MTGCAARQQKRCKQTDVKSHMGHTRDQKIGPAREDNTHIANPVDLLDLESLRRSLVTDTLPQNRITDLGPVLFPKKKPLPFPGGV